MSESVYWSNGRRYEVKIGDDIIAMMVKLCVQAAGKETGGILVGQYTEDLRCAHILAASPAPRDSHSGPTWFYRGVRRLQRWLDVVWARQHQYYLGEWHFHPQGGSRPSSTDILQMEQIAASPDYHCPEPILIIIGGDVTRKWDVGLYVFPQGLPYTELHIAHTGQKGSEINAPDE